MNRLLSSNQMVFLWLPLAVALMLGLIMMTAQPAWAAPSLNQAAYEGNMEEVKALLAGEFNPDTRDSSGGTALHAAMFQKNTEIITLLLQNGFDINAQGLNNGYTPLHDAVWANNLAAVKILVQNGARTDIKGKDGLTPLEKAKKENKAEIAKFLESKK